MKRKTPFDKWWLDSRNWLGPLDPRKTDFSPYSIAKLSFETGRKSVPTSKRLRKALENLLNLLEDWDAGFDGLGEVNDAERTL